MRVSQRPREEARLRVRARRSKGLRAFPSGNGRVTVSVRLTASSSSPRVTALERVRIILVADRQRGVNFEEAWRHATATIMRDDWTEALEWAKEEWRSAYERPPGRSEALMEESRDVPLPPREEAA